MREPASQRNGDDLSDQIGRLDPAHRLRRNRKSVLDRRQRRCHDLNVEDRHEHTKAHQAKADPCPGRREGQIGTHHRHNFPHCVASANALVCRREGRIGKSRCAVIQPASKPSAASVSRVRRTIVPIRPGAQAAAPNIKLRPPLLLARPETMLASRMGMAVSCRAAAR